MSPTTLIDDLSANLQSQHASILLFGAAACKSQSQYRQKLLFAAAVDVTQARRADQLDILNNDGEVVGVLCKVCKMRFPGRREPWFHIHTTRADGSVLYRLDCQDCRNQNNQTGEDRRACSQQQNEKHTRTLCDAVLELCGLLVDGSGSYKHYVYARYGRNAATTSGTPVWYLRIGETVDFQQRKAQYELVADDDPSASLRAHICHFVDTQVVAIFKADSADKARELARQHEHTLIHKAAQDAMWTSCNVLHNIK